MWRVGAIPYLRLRLLAFGSGLWALDPVRDGIREIDVYAPF